MSCPYILSRKDKAGRFGVDAFDSGCLYGAVMALMGTLFTLLDYCHPRSLSFLHQTDFYMAHEDTIIPWFF